MPAQAIVIGGIPIPDDRPIFLVILAVHVACSAVCVVAGALAAVARKRPGRHPRAGYVYYAALTIAVAALIALAILRWPHDVHLLAIGAIALASATLGLLARRGRWRGWLRTHATGMAVSYIALFTGFYVDNGPNLPLWNRLPHAAYWLLPAAVGIPLLLRALHRHTHRRPTSTIDIDNTEATAHS
ncbi:hypothetical protein [Gandjariella thermophila]|uniref:DUF2306 domain-containing protein n=1 Tax=Gandjariella thermophila TaxID=1931992 RepID=A0A4D4JHX1_9PSEU|nr:hypothetical protein [Gandjariella thermophila]GDY33996.1 hypothetical protein GTS_56290 [Gandjariella thermophila]